MEFARFDMRMILAASLPEVRESPVPGHVTPVERRNVTLAPSGGMPVVLTRRGG